MPHSRLFQNQHGWVGCLSMVAVLCLAESEVDRRMAYRSAWREGGDSIDDHAGQTCSKASWRLTNPLRSGEPEHTLVLS